MRLATRGSRLALWQAHRTRELLSAAHPGLEVELVVIESHGDRDREQDISRLGEVGVFTAAIDDALLDGRADAGVHSMKDMTTTLADGLRLCGALARGPVEDVLVSPGGIALDELPAGARVATGSMRRAAMLRHARPELEVVGIRGNVETRLEKLDAGAAEAILLAHAGLHRLGLAHRVSEVLAVTRFVPAAGQGIVGLTCRDDDSTTAAHLWAISDRESWCEGLAERAVLRALRGGCNAPIGVHAHVVENALTLTACVLSVDGSSALEEHAHGLADSAEEVGAALAGKLGERGAEALIEAARS